MDTLFKTFIYEKIATPLVEIRKSLSGYKPKQLSNPPFFILGSGRNGSTLFSAMLNSHLKIFIPPEQYVLPFAIMKWHLFPLFPKYKSSLILNIFLNNKGTQKWKWDSSVFNSIYDHLSNLIDSIYSGYRNQIKPNASLWGDKTPLNSHFFQLIQSEFPNAKIIFLVRDPRDVAASHMKLFHNNPKGVKKGVSRWNMCFEVYLKLKKKNALLHIVKYEDLVLRSQKTIEDVIDFLDLNPKEMIMNHSAQIELLGVQNLDFHQNLKNPISASSIGKWEKDLPDHYVKMIEKKCRKGMQFFSYPFS